ncbi:MAG: DUF3795 domain-containing protein [Oscillospiraceae bacterium]|nr:DUF3795 domain-containing protein [Oscillospiraceae bacterium]
MEKPKITSYCGLDCDTCTFKEPCNCGGCVATKGKPFHGHCDIAECAVARGKSFCGDCEDSPCETLKRYAFDPEHGDNGARIELCEKIKTALVAAANASKVQALFIAKHGKQVFLRAHDRLHELYPDFKKTQEVLGDSVEKGLEILERCRE